MIPFNGTDFKDGYYVVPDGFPRHPDSKAWVVVDVHGAGGLKAPRDNSWIVNLLHPAEVILLVPSFTDGYQMGNGRWAEKLIRNVDVIKRSYPVHETLFVHGHSGGAQFAHRFALHRPELVNGVSAHSAGSWAGEPGFDEININARHIPFLVSCGEDDTDHSMPEYAFNRIEWYKRFASALEENDFFFHPSIWAGTSHAVPHRYYQNAFKECFELATKKMPPKSDGWKGKLELITEYSGRSDTC